MEFLVFTLSHGEYFTSSQASPSGCCGLAEDGGHRETREGRGEGGCADLRDARGLDLE